MMGPKMQFIDWFYPGLMETKLNRVRFEKRLTLVPAKSTMRTLFSVPLVVDPPLLVMSSASGTKLVE